MSKRNKIIAVIFLVLVLTVFLGYQYVYQDHRNISTEEVSYELTKNDLDEFYNSNSENANKKYLDKTILLVGIVTSIDKANSSFLVDEKINCKFNNDFDVTISSIVSVKGRFIGYDELLDEYQMDECSIVSKK